MTVSEAVARRISNLLKERNMTQYRLEKNSNIQHGTMQCIMNGRNKTVTLSIVIMIANGFGMTVDKFLDDPLFKLEELEVE
jgi:transcriptional regulator with XRE-family HTH domain